jgi:hypothetical protein
MGIVRAPSRLTPPTASHCPWRHLPMPFVTYLNTLPFSMDNPSPQFCCQPTYLVWDHFPSGSPSVLPLPAVLPSPSILPSLSPDKSDGPAPMANPFDLEGDKVELTVMTELTLGTPMKEDSAKLLCYHYKYGHVPFRHLQEMAAHGTICHLAHCAIPPCTTCLFGKAHKQPKQTKAKCPITSEAKKPGDCVSVNVLQSLTPGLVAQMSC